MYTIAVPACTYVRHLYDSHTCLPLSVESMSIDILHPVARPARTVTSLAYSSKLDSRLSFFLRHYDLIIDFSGVTPMVPGLTDMKTTCS